MKIDWSTARVKPSPTLPGKHDLHVRIVDVPSSAAYHETFERHVAKISTRTIQKTGTGWDGWEIVVAPIAAGTVKEEKAFLEELVAAIDEEATPVHEANMRAHRERQAAERDAASKAEGLTEKFRGR